MRSLFSLSLAVALIPPIATAAIVEAFVCAGYPASGRDQVPASTAAKPLGPSTEGTRNAIVLFANFHDELPGQTASPDWAEDIFDPRLPGSFSHFYDTMSFGALRVRGQIAPRRYQSEHDAAAYLSEGSARSGRFGQFSLEILRQADADIDFSRFDNDGRDGIPNSGDDDGVADAVFIVTASAPPNFMRGRATGIGWLGFTEDFLADDPGAGDASILIDSRQGTIQMGRTWAQTVGPMCHEFGHVLGLPDLYNTVFLGAPGAPPEEDSAGIGAWGLMGWGAAGWNGDDDSSSVVTEVIEISYGSAATSKLRRTELLATSRSENA